MEGREKERNEWRRKEKKRKKLGRKEVKQADREKGIPM